MLHGSHAQRLSVSSTIETSPCVYMERRKNLPMNPPEPVFKPHKGDYTSPDKFHVIKTMLPIVPTLNSFKFGDEHMIREKHGLLEHQSLENTALQAEGEDISGSCISLPWLQIPELTFLFLVRMEPDFTRPPVTTRSRSSICTSSSGADTPHYPFPMDALRFRRARSPALTLRSSTSCSPMLHR